jgi:hypothetical protein
MTAVFNQAVASLFVFLAVLILINTLLGISLALKKETFKWTELPRFLKTEVLPYYLTLLGATAPGIFLDLGKYEDPLLGIIGVIELAYMSRLMALINGQIKELTGWAGTDGTQG